VSRAPAHRSGARHAPLTSYLRNSTFARKYSMASSMISLPAGRRAASAAHGCSARDQGCARKRTLRALGGPARFGVQRQQRAAARVRLALRRHLAVVHLRRASESRTAAACTLNSCATVAARYAHAATQRGTVPGARDAHARGAHHSLPAAPPKPRSRPGTAQRCAASSRRAAQVACEGRRTHARASHAFGRALRCVPGCVLLSCADADVRLGARTNR